MAEIRLMLSGECSDMAPLARQFFEEGNLPGEFESDHFTQSWSDWIDQGAGVIVSARENDSLIGVIGGLLVPSPTTAELELHEMFWFMDQSRRSGATGLKLLQAFEREGHKAGAFRVVMVHLVNQVGRRVSRLYRRRGYRAMEVHYIREL